LNPWEYPDDMLITLCNVCHKKENTRLKIDENLSTALKMKGFLFCDVQSLITLIYTDKVFVNNLLYKIRQIQNG
jgi:hypothetical protein